MIQLRSLTRLKLDKLYKTFWMKNLQSVLIKQKKNNNKQMQKKPHVINVSMMPTFQLFEKTQTSTATLVRAKCAQYPWALQAWLNVVATIYDVSLQPKYMFRDFCFTGQSDISTYLLENLGLFRWRSSLPVFTQMPILGFAWLVNSKPGQTGIAYGLLLSQPNFNTKQSWGDNIKCKALPVICNFIMTHLDEIWKTTSTFFKWKTI